MLEPRLFLSTTVLFREGGGTGYTDTPFDDTHIRGTSDTAYGSETNITLRSSTGGSYYVGLLAVKDLFTLLPASNGNGDILSVSSAKLHLFQYQGTSAETIYIDRMTSNWLTDSAGYSEADVTFLHRDKSADLHWASGSDFSSSDYTTTNEVSAGWGNSYNQENVFDITALVQDIYGTSTNYGFALRNSSAAQPDVFRSSENSLAYRPVLEITYDYVAAGYTLTVNSGTGDGTYDEDEEVNIAADSPATGMHFDAWTGDTAGVANVYASSTTFTMPADDAEITATYDWTDYSLSVASGSGDGTTYHYGSVINVAADAPATGKHFVAWTGDTSGLADIYDDTTTFTMSAANAAITATYDWTDYTLTVTNGTGDGTTYHYGDAVSIAADAPAEGYVFDEWTGDTSYVANANASSTTFTMPAANSSITATYMLASQHTLTISNGTGGGTYTTGDIINIAATPGSGYAFYVWSSESGTFGDVNDATTTFIMPDADVTIYANCSAIVEHADKLHEGITDGYVSVLFDDARIGIGSDTPNGSLGNNDIRVTSSFVLLGINDLLTLIPQTVQGMTITIESATLHLFRYNSGSSSDTVYVNRMTTDWMTGDAGTNEADVTYMHRDKSANLHWASGGDFSSSDYTTANEASHAWTSVTNADVPFDVTDMVQAIYDSGNNYGFLIRTTSTSLVNFRAAEYDVAQYRPYLEFHYTYGLPTPMHTLTVTGGQSTGSTGTNAPNYYWEGEDVTVTADSPATGESFNMWIGDTGLTMLSRDCVTSAQRETLTPGGTFEVGDKFKITINGQQLVVSATGTTRDQVCDDIVAAINSSALSEFQKVTANGVGLASNNSFTDVRVVANTAGVAFTCSVTTTESDDSAADGQTFTSANMLPNHLAAADNIAEASTTYVMPTYDAAIESSYKPEGSPLDWWPDTNYFDKNTFGAEKEALVYEAFGSTFSWEADGEYTHVSENSAFIACETNLPANCYLEWGTTSSYGNRIDQLDRYYYLNQFSLTGLSNNTTYHYRFVATDERGNILTSSDKTLTTATPAGTVVRLSGGSFSTSVAYTLNQANTTYILTGDVTADYTAFSITAANVTLDLNGHTVVYNNVDYQIDSGNFWDYINNSSFGVKSLSVSGIKIFNGTIKQGAGYNESGRSTVGYSPIYIRTCESGAEMAGLTVEWIGAQMNGIDTPYTVGTLHHNVLLDHGGEVINRQMGISAVGGLTTTHHNLIKRARQGCIGGKDNVTIFDNEMYGDSVCTNSSGIGFYSCSNASVYENKIFGTGYLFMGLGIVSDSDHIEANNNLIHLQATEPDGRWPEYGPQSGTYGIRVVWGGDTINVHDNYFLVYGKDGGQIRGIWMYTEPDMLNVTFSDNVVKAVYQNELSTMFAAVDISGDSNVNDAVTVFQRNRIISNFCNVMFGDEYGKPNNTRFYDNTIVKDTSYSRSDYRTINCGAGSTTVAGHQLFDTIFENGAGYDSYLFSGSGTRNFSIGWSLHLDTGANAAVTIRDAATSAIVFTGTADANGDIDIVDANGNPILLQYMQNPTSTTNYSYNIESIYGGNTYNLNSVIVDELNEVRAL